MRIRYSRIIVALLCFSTFPERILYLKSSTGRRVVVGSMQPPRTIRRRKKNVPNDDANGVVVMVSSSRLVMCLGGVGFARSFEFSFSLGSRWRDGGVLRLIYDNGSGAASPAAEDNFFFFAYMPRERKLCRRRVSGNRLQYQQ
uniref:Uncharacterized protein n=1 Tax=Sipha flava TaxID=143950 RepID=A0A2S2QWB8_9HEMI